MIQKNTFLLLTIILSIQTIDVFSQKKIIKWSEDVRLTWDDFNEKKGTKLAYSAVAIKLKPIVSTTKKIKLEVYAYFDKSKSRTGIYDDKVLEHERLHFLIGELYARKLRKKILLTDKKKFFKDRGQFNIVYIKNYNAYLEYQKKYDKETVNSVDKEKQILWEKKVREELKNYQNYSNTIIEINR
ncbi:hypothetical protein AAON49_06695 [Pseudotenacibaculum sp. MALMAid0570]|uniref:hypothetical protein n=1 Tax=Pseudotenacibaculum sp. MALMAid0570 TaxID=3143938 RepID=UPI0032DFB7B8